MISVTFLGWLLVTKIFFWSPFLVEGPSMEPTLLDGQLFVLDQRAYHKDEPQRGDIIVFAFEEDPDYFYIKRVLGLPGEKIAIKKDGVYVAQDGEMVKIEEPYISHIADSHKQVYRYKPESTQYYRVPEDSYFVLGDNRLHSLDSRSFQNPYIPKQDIKGKYIVTLF